MKNSYNKGPVGFLDIKLGIIRAAAKVPGDMGGSN